jgi:BirA family biotin operon repressor/biotin-[acetyl-CoA-carboxylase] ligase
VLAAKALVETAVSGPGETPPPALLRELDAVRGRSGSFGHPVVFFHETGSTNDVAARLAADGAADGTLVVASAQTRGRGRQGRQWFSPPGAGLYFTLVIRPPADVSAAAIPLLTLSAGVAVAEAVERVCGLAPAIKWPNDLVIETGAAGPSARRKLAGILAEGSAAGQALQYVVLGIGVNLLETAYPPELADRVTSIEREIGRAVDGFRLLAECVATLAARWRQAQQGASDLVLDEWRRRSPSALGAPVVVAAAGGPVAGRTAGVEADGSLRVDIGPTILRVIAGEVQWQ